MKLSFAHWVVLFAAAGPLLGWLGYQFDWGPLVKLGLSLCALYFILQINIGMLRNPLLPVLGFGAGAGWGVLAGHGPLRFLAYGLLLATAVEAVGEAVAFARREQAE
jgi:hypothetical protein